MDPGYQIDETFAWFLPNKKGDHDLKFGASYYYLPLHVFDASTLNGNFTFSASDRDVQCQRSQAPILIASRFACPASTTISSKARKSASSRRTSGRSNNRLTASLGVRYDLEIVPLDQTGNYLFSDPSEYPVDKNNFSPRLGATWTLDEAGTAVVRGGWGLYFQKTAYSNFTPLVNAGAISDHSW